MLTRTGYQLSDLGGALEWTSMRTFLRHLPVDSAIGQELHPDFAPWASRIKTNLILADIYDMLAQINSNLIAVGSHRPAKQPKPYPRPQQKKPENVRHFGSGALPVDELREWFEQKRKEKKCQ